MADPRSDQELMAAHVAGHPRAFDEIVRRHTDRLWAFAVRTLGDSHEASDALQEAFLSAFRAAAGWRGEASVSTWLHRIVYRACLDRVRQRRTHRADPLEEDTDLPTPRDAMADRMTVLAVDEALERLPAGQRAAVVLVDMQGLSVAEAASALGVREGTVKSRAARGRYRLAVLLGHLRPGAGNDEGPADVEVSGGDVSSRAGGER